MSLRAVLLIALGSFLTGLAVCLRDYRLTLVVAECIAFFLAGAEVGEYVETITRNRRRPMRHGEG